MLLKARVVEFSGATILQRLVLCSLIATAPYAIGLNPHERTYLDGQAVLAPLPDPLYGTRATLIIAGLFAAVTSVMVLSWEIRRALSERNWRTKDFFVQANSAMCSIYLGWAVFPYWANGVFTSQSKRMITANLDPKELMPMVWIGELWSIGILLVLLGCQALFFLNLVYCLEARTWRKTVTLLVWVVIALVIVRLSPNYVEWVWD